MLATDKDDNKDICSAPWINGIVLCAHLLEVFNVDMKYEHIQDPILIYPRGWEKILGIFKKYAC